MADRPESTSPSSAPDADAWLRAQADRIGSDPDTLQGLSDAEVRAALETERDPSTALRLLRDHALALQAQAAMGSSTARVSETNAEPQATEAGRGTGDAPRFTGPPSPSWLRLASTVASVLLVVAVGVWMFHTRSLPASARIANVSAVQAVDKAALPAALRDGLEALPTTPETTLGLFPRYDPAEIEAATAALEAAYGGLSQRPRGVEPPERTAQRALAAYALGQAALLAGHTEAAQTWLERAVAEDVSPWSAAATERLDALHALLSGVRNPRVSG